MNVILFSPIAFIGLIPDAPLPGQTWSKHRKIFLLLAQGWVHRAVLRVNMVIMFSASPWHQVMNAKKKLKKKRYINSGTVSRRSERRAFLHGSPCRLWNIQLSVPEPDAVFKQMGKYLRDPGRDGTGREPGMAARFCAVQSRTAEINVPNEAQPCRII